ncbi:unnamed protein product [Lasius platythorax]|uniref:Uncharacterized protein n=1 Tax=Lasius platythorax TaxID=488582 RepID=A0AAV2N1W9_9HYME
MNIALSRIDSRVLITMDEQEERSKDEKRQQEIELPMEQAREQAPNTGLLSFVPALRPAGPFVRPSDLVSTSSMVSVLP